MVSVEHLKIAEPKVVESRLQDQVGQLAAELVNKGLVEIAEKLQRSVIHRDGYEKK